MSGFHFYFLIGGSFIYILISWENENTPNFSKFNLYSSLVFKFYSDSGSSHRPNISSDKIIPISI